MKTKRFLILLGQFSSGLLAYFGSVAIYNRYTGPEYNTTGAILLVIFVPVEFFLLFTSWTRIEPSHPRLTKVMLLAGPVLFCPAALWAPDLHQMLSQWAALFVVMFIDVQFVPHGWALDLAVLTTVFADDIIGAARRRSLKRNA